MTLSNFDAAVCYAIALILLFATRQVDFSKPWFALMQRVILAVVASCFMFKGYERMGGDSATTLDLVRDSALLAHFLALSLFHLHFRKYSPSLYMELEKSELLKLPGLEWEDFMGSDVASWRRLPSAKGTLVEFKVSGPFEFGLHSHPHDEVFTVLEGECEFFSVRPMRLTENQSVLVPKRQPHSMVTHTAGRSLVWWPLFKGDELEIRVGRD